MLKWPDEPERVTLEYYRSSCGGYRVTKSRGVTGPVWRAERHWVTEYGNTLIAEWALLGDYESREAAIERCERHALDTGWTTEPGPAPKPQPGTQGE